MRAVIYARYSSELQRDASIEDQVRICRSRITVEGWQPVQVYSDHGSSGASHLRPGYQKLLEDARAGRFDVVVAESLDRLSRDQEHIASLFKQLSFRGIPLVTVAEGVITEIHVGLKGTMSALYLKDLAQKTRRGLQGRVEAGRSGGGNSYGYEVVKSLGGTGNPERGLRRIKEDEAAVVRSIFQDYAAGKSPKAIAHSLNGMGIPGPSGSGWGPSTINGNCRRGTGILNNELYVGRLVWNRLTYVKDPDTGKRVSRLNSPSEWVVHEAPELRIVEDELWRRVKDRQNGLSKAKRFYQKQRPRMLLSHLLKCGTCGGGFSKIFRAALRLLDGAQQGHLRQSSGDPAR